MFRESAVILKCRREKPSSSSSNASPGSIKCGEARGAEGVPIYPAAATGFLLTSTSIYSALIPGFKLSICTISDSKPETDWMKEQIS